MVMVEFSRALTLSATVLYYRSRIQKHSLDKNRTHDFRTLNNENGSLGLLMMSSSCLGLQEVLTQMYFRPSSSRSRNLRLALEIFVSLLSSSPRDRTTSRKILVLISDL